MTVDAALLHRIARDVTGVIPLVRFAPAMTRPLDDVLQSGIVSAGLAATGSQQQARAEFTGTAISAAGAFPADTADALQQADRNLAAHAF